MTDVTLLIEQIRAWADQIESRNVRGVITGMRDVANDLEQALATHETQTAWILDRDNTEEDRAVLSCSLGTVVAIQNEDGIAVEIMKNDDVRSTAAMCWASRDDLNTEEE
jgi:hypothetical protein